MKKVNLTKTFLLLVIILEQNMKKILEACNGGHYGMVLIKNMTTTTKGDRNLRVKHYTSLTKVVDETIQVHLLQLHMKLLSVESTFKKVNSYPFLCIISPPNFTHKTSNIT